ncbi:MAG: hypothetical protein EON47_00530 [Acetobacteraceae bacterium]|nr:MAG: hypothetical protein EON47_00530 [Acetobacteraceae bacterium]
MRSNGAGTLRPNGRSHPRRRSPSRDRDNGDFPGPGRLRGGPERQLPRRLRRPAPRRRALCAAQPGRYQPLGRSPGGGGGGGGTARISH